MHCLTVKSTGLQPVQMVPHPISAHVIQYAPEQAGAHMEYQSGNRDVNYNVLNPGAEPTVPMDLDNTLSNLDATLCSIQKDLSEKVQLLCEGEAKWNELATQLKTAKNKLTKCETAAAVGKRIANDLHSAIIATGHRVHGGSMTISHCDHGGLWHFTAFNPSGSMNVVESNAKRPLVNPYTGIRITDPDLIM